MFGLNVFNNFDVRQPKGWLDGVLHRGGSHPSSIATPIQINEYCILDEKQHNWP